MILMNLSGKIGQIMEINETEANELSIDEQVLDLVSRTNTFSVVTFLYLDQNEALNINEKSNASLPNFR